MSEQKVSTRSRQGAETPARRSMTAKEGAERLGVSPRTIQRIIAEPRKEFEGRARERRNRAFELRKTGMKYREIAETMGISIGNYEIFSQHSYVKTIRELSFFAVSSFGQTDYADYQLRLSTFSVESFGTT